MKEIMQILTILPVGNFRLPHNLPKKVPIPKLMLLQAHHSPTIVVCLAHPNLKFLSSPHLGSPTQIAHV